VAPIVAEYPQALKWAVIGAASNGRKKYQPDPAHVQDLLDVLDAQNVAVFFKGNLEWSPWREDYPSIEPTKKVEAVYYDKEKSPYEQLGF